MKTIVLISCVSQKVQTAQGETVKAKDLYTSTLFKKAFAYAQTLRPDAIFILSEKYGLLDLDDQVETYDESLKDKTVRERKEWSAGVLKSLKEKNFNLGTSSEGGDKFLILAGKPYYQYLLGEQGIGNYQCMYEGCKGIGYILQFLTKQLEA